MTTLVGTTAGGGSNDFFGAGECVASPYTAVASGTCDEMTVNLRSGSGFTSIKLAIYANSGGSPGSKLGESNAITSTASGLHAVSMASTVSITNGTQYWLAVLIIGGTFLVTDVAGGSYKGRNGPFASFPDPFGANDYSEGANGLPVLASETGGGGGGTTVKNLAALGVG